MNGWIAWFAQCLVVVVTVVSLGVGPAAVTTTEVSHAVEYPGGLEALKRPEALYLDELVPLDDGGLVAATAAWSTDTFMANTAIIRLAPDETLRWYWSGGLTENRIDIRSLVSLGEERIATIIEERTGEDEFKFEVLVIEAGRILSRLVLEYQAHPLDMEYALYPAEDGFYLHTSVFSSPDEEQVADMILRFDRDGRERYAQTLPEGITLYSLAPLADGLLGAGMLASVDEAGDHRRQGVCIRLDAQGETVWQQAAAHEGYASVFEYAAPLADGSFLLVGSSAEADGVYAYGLDEAGGFTFRHMALEDEAFYGSPDVLQMLDGSLALLQGYFGDRFDFEVRVALMDTAGYVTDVIRLPNEKIQEEGWLFLSYLVEYRETLYVGIHQYWWEESPLMLYSLTARQAAEAVPDEQPQAEDRSKW